MTQRPETSVAEATNTRLSDMENDVTTTKSDSQSLVLMGLADVPEAVRNPPSLPAFNTDVPVGEREAEVLRVAEDVFHSVANWVDYYRLVFGVEGLITQMYRDASELAEFVRTPAHAQLQEQLKALRDRDTGKAEEVEPQRMITIRVPRSIHQRLCEEADQLEVSVNKLCISKLIQLADLNTVPKEKGKRRGRRPAHSGAPRPWKTRTT